MHVRRNALAALLLVAWSTGLAQDQEPAKATVLAARYDGKVEGGKVAFDVTLKLRADGKGWQKVRVLPADAPLAGVKAASGGLRFQRGPDGIVALMPGAGDYQAKLALAAPIAKRGQERSIRLPLPDCAGVAVEIELPGPGFAVTTEPNLPATVVGAKASVYPSGVPVATIRWLPKHLVETRACVYSLDESGQLDVGPGSIVRKAVLHFYPVRGELHV